MAPETSRDSRLEIPASVAETVQPHPDWSEPLPGARSAGRTSDRSDSTGSEPNRQWTIVVDLKITFGESTSISSPYEPPSTDTRTASGLHVGAGFEAQKLQELKVETVGKPVTIIVQAARPSLTQPNKVALQQYAIQNGQITELTGKPGLKSDSSGFSDDLTRLLRFADENYPSLKTALFLNAHGGGNNGQAADTGRVTLAGLTNAIESGISKNLAVIDLVSCDMSEDGVLDKMHLVADHLVVSPAVEQSSGSHELSSENLNVLFSSLLKNPSMDANTLAEASITQAKNGSDRSSDQKVDGILTLAHFNLEKYPQFADALDSLGNALAKSIEDPGNRSAIAAVIPKITSYSNPFEVPDRQSSYFRDGDQQKRDLIKFAEAIEKAVDDKLILDNGSELKQSSQRLRQAYSDMLVGYYGTKGITNVVDLNNANAFDYGKNSEGLAIFLPRTESLDLKPDAMTESPLARALAVCPGAKYEQPYYPGIDWIKRDLESEARSLARVDSSALTKLDKLQEQLDRMKAEVGPRPWPRHDQDDAAASAKYLEFARSVCDAAQDVLAEPPFQKRFQEDKAKAFADLQQRYAPSVPGWRNFEEAWAKYFTTAR